ncbi:hypothetical protein GCM10011338_10300 [Alteromonas lipolytica]|nr:hypothetical protein GCM10011338_10300 [Alteromonas lipolytica]
MQDTNVEWLIAERPGKVRALKKHPRKNKTAINIEYLKASIRAKVEHPFRIIKCQFGFIKARYKGLMKKFTFNFIVFIVLIRILAVKAICRLFLRDRPSGFWLLAAGGEGFTLQLQAAHYCNGRIQDLLKVMPPQ